MRLWVLSDLHLEKRPLIAFPPPEFDCLVCAGDVWNEIGKSISTIAGLAAGRPAVFVAGNHEYWSDDDPIEVGRILAEHEGVHLLECDTIVIGGVKFAGATLWEPDHGKFASSLSMLAEARADVIITHYPPTPEALVASRATWWIHGHVHGHELREIGGTCVLRNALGYPGERCVASDGVTAAPFRPDFVIEIWPTFVRDSGRQPAP